MSQASYLAWYTNSPLNQEEAIRRIHGLVEFIEFDRGDVFRSDIDLYLGSDVSSSELYRLYKHGKRLSIHVRKGSKFGSRVSDAVKKIPEKIRGDVCPLEVIFDVGSGYFIDAADEDETKVNYTTLVTCWSYSTPNDTEEMRASLARSKDIHAEKVKLEHILGEVRQLLYLAF